MHEEKKSPSPWLYVITLYLPFGILNGFMQQFPQNLLKLLGVSNQLIGMLSGVGLVASLRFLYAPWLDGATTKRRLSLFTLCTAGLLMFSLAGLIYAQVPQHILFIGLVIVLFIMALTSASHETAADGYYIRALNPTLQAQFIGIKTFASRLGNLSAVMGLLWGATKIASRYGAVNTESSDKTGFYIGFALAYAAAGTLLLIFTLWNKFMIPVIEEDQPVKHNRFALKEVIKEYFLQKRVILIVLIILMYRFGQGFLLMRNPFLLDSIADGGMETSATAMPIYTILTDIPWSIAGGVLGGYLIKWLGLRRTFIPLTLFMSLPNLFYAWLAWARPEQTISIFGENLCTAMLAGSSFESLGYGLSFSAIFYYMHISATLSGRNKTSILAISMCIMNIGFSIPMMISGFVQATIGYVGTFLISSLVGLLAIIIIPFLPIPDVKKAT
ncbi:MAG: hypothetical protein AB7E95_08000 [Kiritimatiellales bacterium]